MSDGGGNFLTNLIDEIGDVVTPIATDLAAREYAGFIVDRYGNQYAAVAPDPLPADTTPVSSPGTMPEGGMVNNTVTIPAWPVWLGLGLGVTALIALVIYKR